MGLSITEKAARTKARNLRDELGLAQDAPVPDILKTVEQGVGVPVAILERLPNDIAGGYLSPYGERLILLNGADHPVRLRFTLAHELAHHCFHDDAHVDTHAGLARPGHWIEVRANRFASEMLMPPDAVAAWVAANDSELITMEVVVAFGAHFGVSAHAALYRLTFCEVLTDDARAARLKAELADDDRLGWFDVNPYEDSLLRAVECLPRLPAGKTGSVFALRGRGELSQDDAAARLGYGPAEVDRALGAVGLLPPA